MNICVKALVFHLVALCVIAMADRVDVQLCGLSAEKPADAEAQQIIDSVKPQVEEKLGKTLDTYKAISYSTQVLKGKKYFVKTQIGDNDYVTIRINKDLNGSAALANVLTTTLDEKISYF